MTNKELIEKMRGLQEQGYLLIKVDSVALLCNRLEAAEAEIESLRAKAYAAGIAAGREREDVNKLKGLLKYCYHLVPRGKTVDAEKWADIEKIVGEG
jgi:hypothetical protein